MSDILSRIVEQRKKDIENLGFAFGLEIPQRKRPIVPFLDKKGVILEIKKASPSKGDIASHLDVAQTAKTYENNGAQAISVLTERNFFKGSLNDLQIASNAVNTAILRKDFIVFKEEISVSYHFGADAILLIARILSETELCDFALECAKYNITPFVEIHNEKCIEKFKRAKDALKDTKISPIAGVNSRDLATFRIDTLLPSHYKNIIQDKVVFESGILTPQAANFAAQRGFYAILVGEAAAKNPQQTSCIVENFTKQNKENKNALFWNRVAGLLHAKSSLPLVKICGLTNEHDALNALELGSDFLGFIFCKKSPRNVCKSGESREIESIINALKNRNNPICVGVITDINSLEAQNALTLAKNGILDVLQFHACEIPEPNELHDIAYYGALQMKDEKSIERLKKLLALGNPRVLVDSFDKHVAGGSGKQIQSNLIHEARKNAPLWLAGGINADNIAHIVQTYNPELVDVSSGLETERGKKDYDKMKRFFENIKGQK